MRDKDLAIRREGEGSSLSKCSGLSERSGLSENSDLTEDSGSFDPPGPTDIAIRVQALKSAAVTAAAKRDRLPRTLFWSLFRTEIDVIKKRKERRRVLQVFSSNP